MERESALSAVRKAFSTHPGDTPVILRLKGAVTTARLLISPRLWVDGSEGLRDELNRVEGVCCPRDPDRKGRIVLTSEEMTKALLPAG